MATRWRSPPESCVGRAPVRCAEADLSERLGCRVLAFVEPDARVEQPVGDIVECGLVLGQEELLEHESDACRSKRRQLPVRNLCDIEPGHTYGACARTVQGADQVEQRRLARPRGSDDGDKLTVADRETHSPKCLDRRFAGIDLATRRRVRAPARRVVGRLVRSPRLPALIQRVSSVLIGSGTTTR